jgi:hypothetical protein
MGPIRDIRGALWRDRVEAARLEIGKHEADQSRICVRNSLARS